MLYMADFTRTDLKLEYSWETAENSAMAVSGFPRNAVFNAGEGYEMLSFLNRYMDDIGYNTLTSFNNFELLLKVYLPCGIRSHHHVKLWLDSSFRR